MPSRRWLIGWFLIAVCSGCGKPEKPTTQLMAELRGDDGSQRIVATRLLAQRHKEPAEVIPALTAALRDNHKEVRRCAALGLGSFGEQAKEAVPALQALLKDPDREVRDAAATAIGRIDPNAARKPANSRPAGGK
jgi:hypothetical protein